MWRSTALKQLQVAERRSGALRLTLTTGLNVTDMMRVLDRVFFSGRWLPVLNPVRSSASDGQRNDADALGSRHSAEVLQNVAGAVAPHSYATERHRKSVRCRAYRVSRAIRRSMSYFQFRSGALIGFKTFRTLNVSNLDPTLT